MPRKSAVDRTICPPLVTASPTTSTRRPATSAPLGETTSAIRLGLLAHGRAGRPVCRPSAVTTGIPPISRPDSTSVPEGNSGTIRRAISSSSTGTGSPSNRYLSKALNPAWQVRSCDPGRETGPSRKPRTAESKHGRCHMGSVLSQGLSASASGQAESAVRRVVAIRSMASFPAGTGPVWVK